MEKPVLKQICKEYGLGILDFVLSELTKIQDFERLIVVKHAHDFLVKECESETAVLLSDETIKAEYAELKSKMDALLQAKKGQIKDMLDIENIAALLSGE